MKRFIFGVMVMSLMLVAVAAFAQNDMKNMDMGQASKNATIKGEIVDMGCYISSGAMGEKHRSCGTKCLQNGMPMGLLTSDGTLYVLTVSHDNADPFNKAKTMADLQVTITGPVAEKNGVKTLEVDQVKEVSLSSK